jgi:hypothetical protein
VYMDCAYLCHLCRSIHQAEGCALRSVYGLRGAGGAVVQLLCCGPLARDKALQLLEGDDTHSAVPLEVAANPWFRRPAGGWWLVGRPSLMLGAEQQAALLWW